MDYEHFSKEISDIIVYPGSIDELNNELENNHIKSRYGLFPMQGWSNRYITGLMMPSKETLKTELILSNSGLSAILGLMSDSTPDKKSNFSSQNFDEETKLFDSMMQLAYSNQEMIDADIRLKAKKMGANGIVHLKLFSSDEDIYMGVPVKLHTSNRRGGSSEDKTGRGYNN